MTRVRPLGLWPGGRNPFLQSRSSRDLPFYAGKKLWIS